MNAQFTVSFEKISDESLASYLIGFQKNDVKDIAIQFLKLQYKKIDKIKFCDNKKSTVAEFVNQDRFSLIVDGREVILSHTNLDVVISFLLDACDNAFSFEEMEIIFNIISTMNLPEHKEGIQFARFHYLLEKYAMLKLESKKHCINNKFKYFKAMIENDRKKKNEYEISTRS